MLKLRKFLASDAFNLIMTLLAVAIVCTDQMLGKPVYYGFSVFYSFIIALVLVLTDDILSAFCPSLILISFLIQYKNSYDAYMEYLWGIPVLAFGILFHIFAYGKKASFRPVSELKLFKPLVVTSISMMLGGVGIMTFSEYFAKINLVNALILGPGALLVYVLFSGIVGPGKNYTDKMDERLAKIFVTVSLFLVFAIFEYYGEHWATFTAKPGILPFQWRNNACTLLMIAMPFSFFLAKKKSFAYMMVPLLTCVAFVLSGSRGGLVFGLLEFVILVVYYAVTDRKHRGAYIAVIILGAAGAGVVVYKYIDVLSYTLDRFVSYKENFRRLGLWKRSVEDYLANPAFGRGVGYLGNRDIHPSQIGQLCWYHSSLPQIWGSLGTFGLLAYGYRFVSIVKFFGGRRDGLSKSVFLAFFGLELMSLVNPGIFAPAYMILITILFVIAEQYGRVDRANTI